jgi:hypothetical protein
VARLVIVFKEDKQERGKDRRRQQQQGRPRKEGVEGGRGGRGGREGRREDEQEGGSVNIQSKVFTHKANIRSCS